MTNDHKIKVLVSAYACEPHKGSEPGVGWNWAKQIARFAEVWVITRANNKDAIEEELKKNPEPNLHFVYVDLPKWLRFWKKGQRGVHLYYLLWQFVAYFKARKLVKEIRFDITHHITFGCDFIFSFLALFPILFIWGPIGHRPHMPKIFSQQDNNLQAEEIRKIIQKAFRRFLPFYYKTAESAKLILLIGKDLKYEYPFNKFQKKKFNFASYRYRKKINARRINW